MKRNYTFPYSAFVCPQNFNRTTRKATTQTSLLRIKRFHESKRKNTRKYVYMYFYNYIAFVRIPTRCFFKFVSQIT